MEKKKKDLGRTCGVIGLKWENVDAERERGREKGKLGLGYFVWGGFFNLGNFS